MPFLNFFQLLGVLGFWGFGVYLAFDSLLNQEVAIKILKITDGRSQHMISKEIEALSSLKHKNIV